MFRALLAFSILAFNAGAQRIDMNPPAFVEARQTTSGLASAVSTPVPTTPLDASKVSSQLNDLLSAFPVSAEFTTASVTLGISVPSSLQIAIMTAVPASVIVDLVMDPSYKSSMASEFQAGNTPAWYTSMPADVQSWFEQFAKEMSTGSPVFTVSSTPIPTTAVVDDTGNAAASSSSKGLAARPTGADWNVLGSAVVVAGVLGLGIAL